MMELMTWTRAALLALVAVGAPGCGDDPEPAPPPPQPAPPDPEPARPAPQEVPRGDVSIDSLYEALVVDDVAALQAQLDAGMPVDVANNQGSTPLMIAAFSGSTESVKVLIERGASVNHRDGVGRTALMYATMSASRDICWLANAMSGPT